MSGVGAMWWMFTNKAGWGAGWLCLGKMDGYVWYGGHVAVVYQQGWMGNWLAMAG